MYARVCNMLAIAMTFLIVAAAGLVAPTTAGAATVTLCNGYSGCRNGGYGDAGYQGASGTSYWGMDPGHNCTNYAAFRLIQNNVDASYLRGQGNAYQWGGVAQSRGVAVNGTPAVGAIAWWAANAGGHGSFGHVAYVEQVGDGVVLLSEDNFGGDFHWVKLTSGTAPSGYIHFKDITPNPPPPPPPPPDADHDGTVDSADLCAQLPGWQEYRGCPAEIAESRSDARTDVNGDHIADFCRLVGGQNNVESHVQCTLLTKRGFGATWTSGVVDWGFRAGRGWVDANGDGRADFCRLVGGQNNVDSHLACTYSTSTGFGATVVSGVEDYGTDLGRAWVDANGDGLADYCRPVGGPNNVSSFVSCTLSTPTGFGITRQSAQLDWGFDSGRAWVDANGDGRTDFCRAVGGQNNVDSHVACSYSTAGGFGSTAVSDVVDYGFDLGRSWADVNGDHRADYCRRVGGQNNVNSYLSCTLSTRRGFGATQVSTLVDWGFDAGTAWVDANGDGRADYCRLVGGQNNVDSHAACTLRLINGFGTTRQSSVLDYGFDEGRAWVG